MYQYSQANKFVEMEELGIFPETNMQKHWYWCSFKYTYIRVPIIQISSYIIKMIFYKLDRTLFLCWHVKTLPSSAIYRNIFLSTEEKCAWKYLINSHKTTTVTRASSILRVIVSNQDVSLKEKIVKWYCDFHWILTIENHQYKTCR